MSKTLRWAWYRNEYGEPKLVLEQDVDGKWITILPPPLPLSDIPSLPAEDNH